MTLAALFPELFELFHDKYAAFIVPAYAVTALVFVWMVADTFLRAHRWRRRAERLEEELRP